MFFIVFLGQRKTPKTYSCSKPKRVFTFTTLLGARYLRLRYQYSILLQFCSTCIDCFMIWLTSFFAFNPMLDDLLHFFQLEFNTCSVCQRSRRGQPLCRKGQSTLWPKVIPTRPKFNLIQIKIQTNVDPNKGQSEQVKIQIKSFHRSVLCGPGHKSIRPHQPNQLGLGFKWVLRPQVIDCTRNWQFYKQMEVGGFLQESV